MRVVYETVEDCGDCPHKRYDVCMKLGRYLRDMCFEQDCPLPFLSDVEQFTRYITPDKKLECHGNCRNWQRWEYNKAIKNDLGICKASHFLKFCHSNGSACEEFEEVGGD